VGDFWAALSDDMKVAVVGAIATAGAALLAALVGGALLIWQIGRQARDAISQNQNNEAMKLKLRVYEEILEVCRVAQNAQMDFRSFVFGFENDVDLRRRGILTKTVPKARFATLSELFDQCHLASVALISLVERWLVVEPRLDLFKTAVNVALHDLREAQFREYVPVASALFPRDLGSGSGGLFWSVPNDADNARLEKASDRLIRAIDLLGSYTDDFQREMQNLLLQDLFPGNRVSPRDAIDPYFAPVRIDHYTVQMAHFENDTAWGRSKQEAEQRARAALAPPATEER
jgi:hypothetical protein